jgi:hypothetical protein
LSVNLDSTVQLRAEFYQPESLELKGKPAELSAMPIVPKEKPLLDDKMPEAVQADVIRWRWSVSQLAMAFRAWAEKGFARAEGSRTSKNDVPNRLARELQGFLDEEAAKTRTNLTCSRADVRRVADAIAAKLWPLLAVVGGTVPPWLSS